LQIDRIIFADKWIAVWSSGEPRQMCGINVHLHPCKSRDYAPIKVNFCLSQNHKLRKSKNFKTVFPTMSKKLHNLFLGLFWGTNVESVSSTNHVLIKWPDFTTKSMTAWQGAQPKQLPYYFRNQFWHLSVLSKSNYHLISVFK
jgi:hypothetical protein